LAWSWLKIRLWRSPSPSTSHLGLSYHCLVSSVLVDPHLFWHLPSYFFLRVLSKLNILFILVFHWLFH
jgi:hypothetical protein